MKKSHKILIGGAVVVLGLGMAGIQYASSKAVDIVKAMAAEQTVLKGKLEIGDFSADLSGNVVFSDVVWTDPKGLKVADVPEMSISANLMDILKGGFGVGSITNITANNPKFSVVYTDKEGLNVVNLINFPKEETGTAKSGATATKEPSKNTETELRGIFEIKNATVDLDMNGQKLNFDKVGMQTNFKEYPKMQFNLNGKNGDADLNGNIVMKYNDVDVKANVKKVQFTELVKVLPKFGELEFSGGIINETNLTAAHRANKWTVNIDGSIADVAAKAYGYNITDGNGSFTVDNNAAVFKAVGAKVEDQPVAMDGKINLKGATKPTYDLNISSPGFKIAAISPGLDIEDKIKIDGKITGVLDNPRIAGNFSMDKLEIAPLLMSDLSGSYRYSNGVVTLEKSKGNVYSGVLNVTGTVEAATKNFAFHIVGDNLDSKAVTETKLSGPLDFVADAKGTGSADSAVAVGTFDITKGNFAGVPFNKLTGKFNRADGAMKFSDIVITSILGTFSTNAMMTEDGKITIDSMKQEYVAPNKDAVKNNAQEEIKVNVSKLKEGLGKLFAK